jgi:hypothetical protein
MSDNLEDQEWAKIGVSASLLKQYGQDSKLFLERLANWLEQIMPSETKVKRRGFFSHKSIAKLTISAGDLQYGIEDPGSGLLSFIRTHVVKGIALKSEEMKPDQWLSEFGDIVKERAKGSQAALDTLTKLIG